MSYLYICVVGTFCLSSHYIYHNGGITGMLVVGRAVEGVAAHRPSQGFLVPLDALPDIATVDTVWCAKAESGMGRSVHGIVASNEDRLCPSSRGSLNR